MRRVSSLIVATAVAILAAAPARAQYQVLDGGFTSHVHGWIMWDTVVAWSADDANDSPFSGSAHLVNTWPTMANAMGIDQCLAGPSIVPGASYDFGGRIYFPEGQATAGWAALGLRWYPEPHCGGDPLEQPRANLNTPGSGFVLVQSTGNVAPAGATSVEFTFYTTKSEDIGVVEAYFDDLFFGPAGTTFTPAPIVVPAAAHVAGLQDTNWRSDLEVYNPTGTAVTYTIALLKRDQANPAPQQVAHAIDPGKSVRFDDVVSSEFGYQGSGALRITSQSGTLHVTSRTYNQVSAGTYGQFIAGEGEDRHILYGGEGSVVQLRHDSAYRTNLGIVNVVDMPVSVDVDLYTAGGVLLGSKTIDLGSWEHHQVDGIFATVTGGDVNDGYAVLRTTTPDGRFLAYASVVDNATGDAIYIPATSRMPRTAL